MSGQDKRRWRLFPFWQWESVVRVLEEGARKYGEDAWRALPPDEFGEAMIRHFVAWSNGERLDPDSGEPHLAHVMANAVILLRLEAEAEANEHDARQVGRVLPIGPPVA